MTEIVIKAPVVEPGEFVPYGPNIQAAGARHPDKLAVVDDRGEMSWGAFAALAGRVARRLSERGIGPGRMVATLAENSAANLATYSGALIAGACVAPLPVGSEPGALARMRADSAAPIVFASAAQFTVAQNLGADEVVLLDELESWAQGAEPLPAVEVAPTDLFDMIYSSGTTGTPKGIVHDALFRSRQLDRFRAFGIGAESVHIMATPLYSNTTLVAVLPTLTWGGTVLTMGKFDCGRFLDLAQTYRATQTMLVPVQYMRLMDFAGFDDFDLSSFAAKFSTSAPLPGRLIERVQARWPGNIFEFYGMTEGGVSCILNVNENPAKWDTVGKPAEGCDVVILGEDLRELGPGELGEIAGRSGSMMVNYHNQPAKTKELIWRNAKGEDFIRTGDIGRLDEDGFLQLLDRKKDMILSGGFNIYAADLEHVLRAHPAVRDVAVIAVPSDAWGETPLGVVVADGSIDAAALLNWANAQLGKTQRLSAIEFRDDLPRSAIGKILKRELRAPYWEKADA